MKDISINEPEIIKKAQAGDADAFGELYQLHLDAIYSYVYKRVSDVGEAENITQTVFIKAWQALERYQPQKVPFRAWLYRIAHNTVIDHYRKQKETVGLEDQRMLADSKISPEAHVEQEDRINIIKDTIHTLRPAYQQVLSLRFLKGLDYKETAEVLGRKVNAVRVLQFRALEALQKALQKQGMEVSV